MKNIKTFETFDNPTYSVVPMDNDEFYQLIRKEKTLEDRIRFFSYTAANHVNDPMHFVLFIENKVIGICKLDIFDSADADYSICYVSIDRQYRNKKLTRLIIETMVDWMKEHNYTLGTSSWTVPGNLRLRPLVKSITSEKGVKFYDKDEKHDVQWMYNDDMININEMTPKELKKHNKRK